MRTVKAKVHRRNSGAVDRIHGSNGRSRDSTSNPEIIVLPTTGNRCGDVGVSTSPDWGTGGCQTIVTTEALGGDFPEENCVAGAICNCSNIVRQLVLALFA